MKRILVLALALMLAVLPVSASSLSDKKNELNSTEQNIKDKQAAVEAKQQQKAAIEAEIKAVDLQTVEIQDNIKELDIKLDEKQQQIGESEKELEAANEKKDEQYDATKERMIQMYKNQNIGYIQIIFSSSSFWEAMNRAYYVKRISQKDNSILDEYQAQIDIIEEQKRKIEAEKNELDELQKAALAKNKELESIKNKKEAAMDQLAAEEGKLRSEIENLEQVSAELKNEINELTSKLQSSSSGGKVPTQYTGGTFMWPVPGYYRISSEYGWRGRPLDTSKGQQGSSEFHTGLDIPASYGEDVVAAADGVVIKAGWVNGYGNTIMISHGSGLVTLYGHNSSLTVSNGQSVKKGEVVARIGSTGWSTGNHCHFEVRINGDHTSPWAYLND